MLDSPMSEHRRDHERELGSGCIAECGGITSRGNACRSRAPERQTRSWPSMDHCRSRDSESQSRNERDRQDWSGIHACRGRPPAPHRWQATAHPRRTGPCDCPVRASAPIRSMPARQRIMVSAARQRRCTRRRPDSEPYHCTGWVTVGHVSCSPARTSARTSFRREVARAAWTGSPRGRCWCGRAIPAAAAAVFFTGS